MVQESCLKWSETTAKAEWGAAKMRASTETRIGTSNLVPPSSNVSTQPTHAKDLCSSPSTLYPAINLSLRTPARVRSASAAQSVGVSAGSVSQVSYPHLSAGVLATPHSTQTRRPPSSQTEQRPCNCRNSKCLKLYCECFASGRYCTNCNCTNCMNNKEHETERSRAIETILERNPNAFRPKIQYQQADDGVLMTQVTRHCKGCSCRKSNCLKKYCECFQAGIFCGPSCRCRDCRNFEGSEFLTAVIRREDSEPSSRGNQAEKRMKVSRGPVLAPIGEPPSTRPKRDPAREAINNLRDKRMHEVLAKMLTTLHANALSKEKARRVEAAKNSENQPAAWSANAADISNNQALSDYYTETEGVLLGEFGAFLGTIADKIDEQVNRNENKSTSI